MRFHNDHTPGELIERNGRLLAYVAPREEIGLRYILASALLARSGEGGPSTENRIALGVCVVSVVVALVMLARIALQTRHVRSHRRT